jgi:hypothetical protein
MAINTLKKFQSNSNLNEINIRDELIVYISIYHPITRIKNQEFKFLGNQPLSDIIDKM